MLKAAAGRSDAPGGQAAISPDGPPTRRIRTAALSPGPARFWSLARVGTLHHMASLGEDERKKQVNPGQERATSPSGCQGPFLGVQGVGGDQNVLNRCPVNETGLQCHTHHEAPLPAAPRCVQGLICASKTLNLGLRHTFLIKDPNWIFMFAERAVTKSVGSEQNRKRGSAVLSPSPPFPPEVLGPGSGVLQTLGSLGLYEVPWSLPEFC